MDPRIYSAEVVRIIDGDTFVARVRTWANHGSETRVRLRSIDAAELHARCARELHLALAARGALQRLLADGRVTLSHVGRDKYPGRIDAEVATRGTADVSAAMLSGGTLHLQPLASGESNDAPKTYSIALLVGQDRHVIDIVQAPVR